MVIKGITDRRSNNLKADIKIWKGEVKGERSAGKTLQEKFRIDTGNSLVKKHLINAYKNKGKYIEEKDSFLLVDELNIFLACEHPEKAFDTRMTGYEGGKLVRVCDRNTIFQEREKYEDITGIRYYMMDCNKPCHADQDKPFSACSLGCTRSGTLYFYLWELLDLGVYPLCSIETSSWEDIINLTPKIAAIGEQFGSIKTPEYPIGNYYGYIPLILTRAKTKIMRPQLTDKSSGYKRTGEKAKGETWALAIAVNPDWRGIYNKQRQLNEVKQLGYAVSQKLLSEVYSDAIDVEVKEIKSIAPVDELKRAYNENKWTSDGWLAMLRVCFGVSKTEMVEDKDLLIAIAQSTEEREKYCSCN